ncbi:TPA: hypothetical protein ACW2VG_000505 [Burkholderia stabilis]
MAVDRPVAIDMTKSSCSRHGRDQRKAEHEVGQRRVDRQECYRWSILPSTFVPFAPAVLKAGGSDQTFIPARKVNRTVLRSALIAILFIPFLAGCASTRSDSGAAATRQPAAKPVAADLMPGEQIDYAGHRCGNPNLYVKTHPCLFPKRNATP